MPKFNEEEILRRLKHLSQIEPTPEATERAKERARQTLTDKQKRRESSSARIWRAIIQSPITKVAAAAVIIIAVGLFLVHRGPGEQVKPTEAAKVAKSPAEMVTLASFTFAYRHGGMEAVEEICDKAFKIMGPRPSSLSVRELFEEINGNGQNSERKKL